MRRIQKVRSSAWTAVLLETKGILGRQYYYVPCIGNLAVTACGGDGRGMSKRKSREIYIVDVFIFVGIKFLGWTKKDAFVGS